MNPQKNEQSLEMHHSLSIRSKRSRLAVFVCYDRDGVIDDYVLFLLKALHPFLKKLVIVVNGRLNEQGREKLEAVSSHIHLRENKGYDAGAWKDALLDYVGWDEAAAYDEILLANDTFFGPLYPFEEMFAAMDAKDVDFWGITAHGETNIVMPGSLYPHLPAHIQSYFMVFRRSLHTDKRFIEYWEKQPYFQTMTDVIAKHETCFTQYFAELGFRWAVYTDTSDMDGIFPDNRPIPHCFYNAYELIARRRCPILKRHSFGFSYQNHLDFTNGMQLCQAVAFIDAETDYDVSMIYRNIIRIYNVTDIFFNLHLSFILPKKYRKRNVDSRYRAVLVFHVSYMELLEELRTYLADLPSYVDVILTTKPEEKREDVEAYFRSILGERLRVLTAPDVGRDFSAFLVAAAPYLKTYDYVGFCHDKRSHTGEAVAVGEGFRALIVENTLGSGTYVENVLGLLASRPEIGVLSPPPPHHAAYFWNLPDLWCTDYEITKDLAKRLGIKANFSKECAPLMVGTAFWCRREALVPLLEYPWKEEHFPQEPVPIDGTLNHALERIFPFVAQSQGFLTGWMMTDEYAALEVSNLHYLLPKAMAKPLWSTKTMIVACVKEHLPRPFWGVARKIKNLLGW